MQDNSITGSVQRSCLFCGSDFFCWPNELRRGVGLFCSPACRNKSRAIPAADRFWAKVQKCDGDGCWNWSGARDLSGYGKFAIASKPTRLVAAHRYSWEIENRPLLDGECVLHKCDNRLCVRPAHLFVGSLSDNTQDMLSKKRNVYRRRALTMDVVRDIRMARAAGASTYQIAIMFGISHRHARGVCNHESWVERS